MALHQVEKFKYNDIRVLYLKTFSNEKILNKQYFFFFFFLFFRKFQRQTGYIRGHNAILQEIIPNLYFFFV